MSSIKMKYPNINQNNIEFSSTKPIHGQNNILRDPSDNYI